MTEEKKHLIKHIMETNRKLGIYEAYTIITKVPDNQKHIFTTPTRNYLNGLLSAFELIFGNTEELKELESSLLERRLRAAKLMMYLRKIYLERELAKKKAGGVK